MSDALRFCRDVVTANGQRGVLTVLSVRGGESNYNRVIVDGVSVNEPGGQFDFGVVPVAQIERMEVVRGSESAVYGSDAMTSVVQMWTRERHNAHARIQIRRRRRKLRYRPRLWLRCRCVAALRLQPLWRSIQHQRPGANNAYSNTLEGANIGVQLATTGAVATARASLQQLCGCFGRMVVQRRKRSCRPTPRNSLGRTT